MRDLVSVALERDSWGLSSKRQRKLRHQPHYQRSDRALRPQVLARNS